MPTQMTKSQLIEKIAEHTELGKKDVKAVIENMVTVGHKELKKTGVFLVPGFAKFVVIKKPRTVKILIRGRIPCSGERIPCSLKKIPCYASKNSLFRCVGNFSARH